MARYYIILATSILVAVSFGWLDGFVANSALILVVGMLILERFSSILKYKKTRKLKPLFIVILIILVNSLIAHTFVSYIDQATSDGGLIDTLAQSSEHVIFDKNIFFRVLSFIVEHA